MLNLVSRLINNKRDNVRNGNDGSPGAGSKESSIMTDDTQQNDYAGLETSFKLRRQNESFSTRKSQGLINLSFEKNPTLGDRGAEAVANLIMTQNAFSNNLKMVNLNECGITNAGFESLK